MLSPRPDFSIIDAVGWW